MAKGARVGVEVYRLTKKFPKDELFALVSQIRRAVISITSNIAEGFGRFSEKEKSHFYFIAYGSLMEVLNQLMASRDLGYINTNEFQSAESKIIEISKMLQSLMRKIKV